MEYTQSQWILFFFIYATLGWIWECCYVSVKQKEWINRGFLHGPILPIYGFGAIILLWLTLPFRNNLMHVYILGLIGATLLEYVTGAAMERLFGVRYWDYSNQPYNFKGYICLSSSIAWGGFTLLMTEVLHPVIEVMLLSIPHYLLEPISSIFLFTFAVDTTISVQSALDMKGLMKKLAENNVALETVKNQLDTVAEDIEEFSEKFKEHVEETEVNFQQKMIDHRKKSQLKKQRRQVFILEKLRDHQERKLHWFELLYERIDTSIKEIDTILMSSSPSERSRLDSLRKDLLDFKTMVKEAEINRAAMKNVEYQKALSIIQRNPTSISPVFKDAFAELKKIITQK